MRGSIKKNEGKKGVSYTAIVDVGTDPVTGDRKQKKMTFKTKKEAEKWLSDTINKVNNDAYIEPQKQTIGEYLKNWLENHSKPNLAVSTYRCYGVAIYQHIIPAIGNIPLSKLQPLHIQDMYAKDLAEGRQDNKKTTGKRLSPTTVNMHHRILHKALKQAMKWQLISRNPADLVDPPRKEKKEINILNEKQANMILKDIEGTYLYMPVFLAVYTGMREGEILGLTWKDVDFNRGVIRVRQILYQRTPGEPLFKQPKTAGSRRTIDISPIVVKTLKEHKKTQLKERMAFGEGYAGYDLVCCLQDGNPINPPTLSSAFRVRAARRGLFVCFHGLRHTHASLMLKAEVPAKVVSERLGHSQIGITMDTYSTVMPGMQREAANKLEELLAENRP